MPDKNSVSFQTRARTVDHLGRGQIADLPTAITELWKNAYDAYAKDVSLHIFQGSPEIATVFDDGFGMTRDDFVDRWLVIGTEAKIDTIQETEEERFGLPERPRQGEKGIGRLSAAFIAPVTLVVSKKVGMPFAAALVDWRLFENPFLALSDIRLPVREFDNPVDLKNILPGMYATLRNNVSSDHDSERSEYIREAWAKFSTYEKGKLTRATTTEEALLKGEEYTEGVLKCLEEWFVFQGLNDHGTAMVMIGIMDELAAWVSPGTPDPSTQSAMENLRETLNSFTDALAAQRMAFEYEVWAHQEQGNKRIIGTNDVFGFDDFMGLEHFIYGEFDENGVFKGYVTAYGKDRGEKTFTPKIQVSSDYRGRVGAFKFCIGTFEVIPGSSTHSESQHKILYDMANDFGGLRIYRDGLRVMPYGRPEADFFDIEFRRSKHAGREFWSYRRSFGRVAVSSVENPNLKDKAGREGLVDNRAKRDLKLLVRDLLMEFARRYFGTASPLRVQELPDIVKRNLALKNAAEKARKRRKSNLREFLTGNQNELELQLKEASLIEHDLQKTTGLDELTLIFSRIKDLSETKSLLRPPPAPPKNDNLEEKYRKYRDIYNELSAHIDRVSTMQTKMEAEFGSSTPKQAIQNAFSSRQSRLSSRVDGYLSRLKKQLDGLHLRWCDEANVDRGKYYQQCIDIMNEDPNQFGLVNIINFLDVTFRELEEEISLRYEAYAKDLDQLSAGIDLDGALSYADHNLIRLEEHVEKLNAVAQLGITVEIIGHELETMDQEARRNLKRLPEDVKQTASYKSVFESLTALTDRLRFLAPMKIAGYRAKERITGKEIATYLEDFFEFRFRDDRIKFKATDEFRCIEIFDLRSRIFPVFINLINNAAYWVTRSIDRQIILDVLNKNVIISDSGPGVDPDDIERLFTLFFTRKQGGRGVGLYLAKANLAVGNHSIWYAKDENERILTGANFVVKIKE
ncbi:MAG: ATP-binding protein [Pseudomonadota bacterium]